MLNEEKKKKKENSKEYYEKVQERKSKLDSLHMQFERVDKLKRDALPKILEDFSLHYGIYGSKLDCLKEFCTLLQKCLCTAWGGVLSLHFKDDKRTELNLKML